MLEPDYLLLPHTVHLPLPLSAKSGGAVGPAWCRQPREGWQGRGRSAPPVLADPRLGVVAVT